LWLLHASQSLKVVELVVLVLVLNYWPVGLVRLTRKCDVPLRVFVPVHVLVMAHKRSQSVVLLEILQKLEKELRRNQAVAAGLMHLPVVSHQTEPLADLAQASA